MVKKIGYYLFAAFFSLFRLFPLQKNKVFIIATHDDSEEGNAGIVAARIRQDMPEKKLIFLTKKDGIRHPFSFFFAKAYHLATASVIFMDNVFMPMAYTKISKKAKVVQLWHGTGTIKKFGQDSDPAEVVKLAKKADNRITHLIVNSELTKKQYMGAFGLPEEKVYILGLPRTDLILNEKEMQKKQDAFYKQYPELKEKRCILYAPTFRDSEVTEPKVHLDFDRLTKEMTEHDVLLLKLHPHVAANFSEDTLKPYQDKVRNVSAYPGTSSLLAISDMLITDYSSITFEYCLFDRPMIFYAYDLNEFEQNGRSFYEPYRQFVPGPVVENQEDMMNYWDGKFDFEKVVKTFRESSYVFLDEKAVNRLFELIF